MLQESDKVNITLLWAIVCAILLHVIIALIAQAALTLSPQKNQRSIPVLLVSDSRQQQIQSTAKTTKAESSRSSKNLVSTSGESSYNISSSENPVKGSGGNSTKPKPRTNSDTPTWSDVKMPELSQSSRAQRAETGLRNLFAQSKTADNTIRQQSSSEKPILSEYEILLIQRLSDASLYDRYHHLMDTHQKESFGYTIELVLFPNGAIKNAKIIESSSIAQLDELAKTTAYNASPYPRPPESHRHFGFKYLIPIEYHKSTDGRKN